MNWLRSNRKRTRYPTARRRASLQLGARFEALERRDLLAGIYTVLQPVFLDGLGYADPEVHNRIAAITTWNSQEPIYLYGDASGGGSNKGEVAISPNTAQSGPLINLDDFRGDARFSGIDGSGFASVILDTGIDLNHPYFGPDLDTNGVSDRIVYHYDFADGDADASDNDNHGSNVSSIVASSDGTNTGMAPGSGIIHLKVFTDAGGGNFGYIESALQWVVANAATFNISSINMSLGNTANYNTPQTLFGIDDELAALAALDVITVSSSGNDFFDFSSAQGVGYPAADPNSLSVGAVYDGNVGGFNYGGGAQAFTTGPGRITPFSQRSATMTDIMAPGAPITGANATGGTVSMHGTSQSSPHIAGIATLAQHLADQVIGRRLTVAEFTGLLQSSATTINDGDDENDNVTNTGLDFPLVDVFALGEAIWALQPYRVDITESGSATTVAEGGATDTYDLKLRTAPTGAVEVTVSADAQTEVSRDGTNFSSAVVLSLADTTPQTITVRAIDDSASEGTHSASITHAITATADPTNYPTSMAVDPVAVTIADNELAGFVRQGPLGSLVAASQGNAGTLASSSDQRDFGVALAAGQRITISAQPDAAVTLSVQIVGESSTYSSAAAGEAVTTPPITIPAAGNYVIRVTADAATDFELQAWLNSSLELAVGDSADGNELAITDSFLPLGSGRYGVRGTSTAVPPGGLQFTKTNSPASFINISGTGTALDLADDGSATINTTVGNTLLPAGSTSISNNGVLVAGGGVTVNYINAALPTTDFGQALVPFWDDLDNNTGKEVYWEERLVGGINTLIVQWDNRPHWDNIGSATFQIQLFASGPILARYAYSDVDFGNAAYNGGASATIGVQASSTSASQFSFNAAVLANGDIIDITDPATADVDEYTLDLTGKTGQPLDIVLRGASTNFAGELLELLDTDGTSVLATAVSDPVVASTVVTNYDLGILDFLVPADGVYTLRLTSWQVEAPYDLLITEDLVFDSEPNNTPATDPLRSLDAALAALGYIDSASDANDYYEVSLTAGQSVTISTQTPFDTTSSAPANTLNPELEVIHPDGSTIVASDQDSATDGKNATVTFTAPVTGSYRLRIRATAGAGEYRVDVADTQAASVVGRHIFYNNSTFDGNGTSLASPDSAAIDSSKSALVPGTTATLSNYSGYSRGINGITVDIMNLATTPQSDLSDIGNFFQFRMGNDSNPAGWAAAPTPSGVAVIPGGGVSGSDRVLLSWADNQIVLQWLQVIVKSGAATGLATRDVHYWGNSPGETGNASDTFVTAADAGKVIANFTTSSASPVSDANDLNKDSFVTAADVGVIVTYFTTTTSLILLSAPNTGTPAEG